MAVAKFTDAIIYLGSRSIQGKANQVSIQAGVDMIDATVFGQSTKVNLAGLISWNVKVGGFWDSGTDVAATGVSFVESASADSLFARVGAAKTPITIAPANVDLGPCYFLNEVESSYQTFGAIGQAIPFSLECMAAGYLTKGVLALPPVQKTALGTGTGIQLGALSAGQSLVASMHVIQFNGTTMTMSIESDNDSGFGSATSVGSFAAATGLTSEWKVIAAGPVTDDYFRTSWTFTGTSFTAVVALGIYTP